ncbi:MAG: tripartite tricarboxylate transporter substrate-binding protein, partial [Pigmentiphaga sp.]|nr:tripartite tricarboxylate transporter substrate-binding protein [Pigmentiphaga sp.]
PKAVVDKLNDAINQVMRNPEYRSTMEAQGTELETLTPAETLAFVQEDARKLNALMKHVPLKMD